MGGRKGQRVVRPEETALWRKAMERTRKLQPEKPKADVPSDQVDEIEPSVPRTPIAPFRLGERPTASRTPAPLPSAPSIQMDNKAHKRMTRGKLTPEARIDLHGMTQDVAHPALTRFISDSYSSGRRLVLVITGKGKTRDGGGPIPERVGVLRHQVPHWLSSGSMRAMVLQVTEAHRRHGGGGAYYVYLRKRR